MLTNCVRCGSEPRPRANFCGRCGASLADGAEPEPAPAPLLPDAAPLLTDATPASDAPQWGIGAAALGVGALFPSALLVSMLAFWLPLSWTTVIATILLASIQFALVWALAYRTWPPNLAALGLRWPRKSLLRALAASGLALVCSLGFAAAYGAVADLADLDFLVPPELPTGLLLPGEMAIISVAALAIVTPLAEEVFFRGFVMGGLASRWGQWPAVLVSAAVFATLHIQPSVILPVFVTGILLGVLYWYTGSIWPGILVHAGQNLIATLGLIFAS